MAKLLTLGLLVFYINIGGILATIENFQTSTYDDMPEECVTRIDPSPFVKIGSNYYLVEVTKTLNFFDASDLCKWKGGELVSFETEAELDAVAKYLFGNGHKDKWIWTSANDLGSEGTHKFLGTGKPMNYARWTKGQPDDAFGGEDCVNLWPQDGTYYMNDLRCGATIHYICEMAKPKTITFTAR